MVVLFLCIRLTCVAQGSVTDEGHVQGKVDIQALDVRAIQRFLYVQMGDGDAQRRVGRLTLQMGGYEALLQMKRVRKSQSYAWGVRGRRMYVKHRNGRRESIHRSGFPSTAWSYSSRLCYR